MLAQGAHARQQFAALIGIDQSDQRVADFKREIVERQQRIERVRLNGSGLVGAGASAAALSSAGGIFCSRQAIVHSTATMRKKENFGMPGIRPMANMAAAGDPEHARLGEKLLAEISAQRFVGGGAGDHQASGDGDQQRRNHGDQAVAHGEDGVGLQRVAEGNVELEDSDQKSGDDVDGGEQNGGQRVALAEAGGAVHGAVELGFAGHRFAAGARLVFVDQSGVQVGVDGHLFAGHGVQGEARRDLGGAHRAVADHQKLNGDQGDEQHEADHVVAAHHKLPEGGDHVAGGGGAFIAVQQNAARAGQVQRQPEESEQQQQAGKDGELHRAQDVNRREQDHHRRGDAHGQQQVEKKAGQGTSMTKTTETAAAGTIQSKFAFLRNGAAFVGFCHQEFLRPVCCACMRKT